MDNCSIPVTVLTGYLGSGKTTLLNHILTQEHGKKIAVIINEFAPIGIDNQLIVKADESVFEMNNGSICCTVRKDLIRIIQDLIQQQPDLDHILIETTGLADPAPVVQTFFVDETLSTQIHLEAVVTVVDAKHIQAHWEAKEIQEQIRFANVVLLNKADLVTVAELDELEAKVRSHNSFATIHRTQHSQTHLDSVLGLKAFDVNDALSIDADFLSKHVHEHDKSVSAVAIAEHGAVNLEALNAWLHDLLHENAADTFRMKGIFNVSGQRYAIQGVHAVMNGQYVDAKDLQGELSLNELVFIGRNLEEETLRTGLRSCFVAIQ